MRASSRVLLRTGQSAAVVLGASVVLTVVLDAPAGLAVKGRQSLWLSLEHWVSMVVVGTCLTFLVFLTGRLWLSVGLSTGTVLCLALANARKLQLLGEPVLPADLAFLGTPELILESAGGPAPVVLAVVATAAATLVGGLTGRVVGRRCPTVLSGRQGRLCRLAGVLATSLVLTPLFVLPYDSNPYRRLSEIGGARWLPWSQVENFATNGFVAGSLYNLPVDPMPLPVDYEADDLDDLVAPGAGGTAPLTSNLVIILSESFGDPSSLGLLEPDRDPLRLWRARSEQGWSLQVLAPYYGTGTSVAEFQVLTAQNIALLSPQIVSPYQQFVAERSTYPSLAWWWREHGGRAVAVHPFDPHFYRRSDVYPRLGFQDFYSLEDFPSSAGDRASPFITDESTFDFVLDLLYVQSSPTLVHTVTMQNHVPFGEQHLDPIDPGPRISGDESVRVGDYLRGLELSSEALDEFLTQLEHLDEPTLVVYFGDHLPGIFDSVRDATSDMALRSMPALLWSTEHLPPRDLGLRSATELSGLAMRALGVDPPPFVRSVERVASELGAFTRGYPSAIEDPPDGHDVLEELQREQYALVTEHPGRWAPLWGLPRR